MNMHSNELELRSVGQLLNESFFIPAYQRGYRWTSRQVTELLEDVFAFMQETERNTGKFYCLQPIVVARRDGHWELIDGQQRLTTLYLILSYFNNRLSEDGRMALFSLNYETRAGSQAYLLKLDEQSANSNIDFFHMYASYRTIHAWFNDKRLMINRIEDAFLNQVKVIWYEVRHDIDPVEVFTRLNIGKIALTNTELVKALFLRASNFECGENKRTQQLNQLKIAQEWDDMERRLQDDDFWYFLTKENTQTNRMEFVLNLRADEICDQPALKSDPAYLFLAFNARMRDKALDVLDEWNKVKQIFLLLDEWFKDRYFYHLIGYLVHQGGNSGTGVAWVREAAVQCASKTDFRKKLKAEIFRRLFLKDLRACENDQAQLDTIIREFLDEADYETNGDGVRKVLLLFNLVSLLENEKTNARFPFNFFKQERWDIEHIRSVHSNMPDRTDAQKHWIGNVLDYLGDASRQQCAPCDDLTVDDGAQLLARLRAIKDAEPFDVGAFEAIFSEVINRYDPDGDFEADNSIGNLTLLDAATNRSYKNAIFPIKRKTLIDLDKVGKFVPLCTKNAFLKYYSPRVNDMLIWTKEYTQAHQAAMHASLFRFFAAQGVNA